VSELFNPNVPHIVPQQTNFLPSFVPHTRAILTSLQIQVPPLLTSPLISPFPPWFNFDNFFTVDFSPSTVLEAAVQIFSELVNFKYSCQTAIFTDGSHITTPNSTSAAFAIPSKGVLLSWKRGPEI
jgi:hypothetical protein